MDPRLIEMCEKLGIDPDLVEAIFTRPDWEFVILAGAFLEAVSIWRLKRIIKEGTSSKAALGCHKTYLKKKHIPTMDLINVAKEHDYLSENSVNFLQAFYNVRHKLAHNVQHMGYTFADDRENLSELRQAMEKRLGRAGDLAVDVRECVRLAAEQEVVGRADMIVLPTLTADATAIAGSIGQGSVTLPEVEAVSYATTSVPTAGAE